MGAQAQADGDRGREKIEGKIAVEAYGRSLLTCCRSLLNM
jgi:hypothetical protein